MKTFRTSGLVTSWLFTLENSVDSEQLASEEKPADLDLQCF